MRDIVVVGSLNVDISVQASHLPRAGETVRADGLKIGPGGKGLNQAVGAARLGGRVHMVGRVGDDEFAAIPEQALAEAGVDAEHVRRLSERHTGTALILVGADSAQNMIAVAAGANRDLKPEDLDDCLPLFRASGVLMVQLELPLETVERALNLAHEYSLQTLLDPSPPRKLPDQLLRKVDVLTPNEVEAELLTGVPVTDVPSAAEAGARLRERSLSDVVITLGSRGCVWISGTGFEHIPAPRVEALDTTGAGDAFNAGLALGLARGEPLLSGLQAAVRAGSASTLRRGAAAAMPTPEDVTAIVVQA